MAAFTSNAESDVNILLLGETGVGKSTFINAFANYLTYDNLPEEKDQNLVSLIPTSFTMYNDEDEEVRIAFGPENKHESFAVGEAATRYPSGYEFQLADRKVRIIDTPGIGDPRGINQDSINFANILSFISDFEYLHCICILLKPNHARLSVTFDFCIKQLLCHLQKDASKNIVFVYTNARSTFYKPGDTGPLLKKMLKSIEDSPPHVKISHDLQRVYCMDNEAFRFILALHKGMKFDEATKKDFRSSWNKSAGECQRLMKYIIGCMDDNQPPLQPHKIKDTISVNTARSMIHGLSRPLADIIDNISLNLALLQKHKTAIENTSNSISLLKDKLFIPVVRMKVVKFEKPQTVCTNVKCSEVQSIEGVQRYVTKKFCHDPCTVRNIPGDIIGHAELQFCEAMDYQTGNCTVCDCSYLVHLHKYYGIEEVQDRVMDNDIEAKIKAETDANKNAETILKQSQNRINAYEKERRKVTDAMAKFAYFLQQNAIICYNNAFIRYIEYKIQNLEALAKQGDDSKQLINELRKMIAEYETKIKQLDEVMEKVDGHNSKELTADDIFKIIDELKNLEISGEKIIEMQQAQEISMKEEFKQRIVVVKGINSSGFFNFIYRKGIKVVTSLVSLDGLNLY